MAQGEPSEARGGGEPGERRPLAKSSFFEGQKAPPAAKRQSEPAGGSDPNAETRAAHPRGEGGPAPATRPPAGGGSSFGEATRRHRAQYFVESGKADSGKVDDGKTVDISEREILESTAAGRSQVRGGGGAADRSTSDTATTLDQASPPALAPKAAAGGTRKLGKEHAGTGRIGRGESSTALRPGPAAAPADPFLGKTIGGCRLERFLGRGGMGSVYYAIQVDLDRPVAFKILSNQLTADPRQVAQFFREAKALAKVEHPNIVPIYNAAKEEDVHFIVMKLVEGGSLEGVIKRDGPRLPLERALKLVDQAARGLFEAHLKGITHRDVKPENMLVEPGTDRLMVTDFGLARMEGDSGLSFGEGRIVGTPYYMSPEQIDGRDVDGRTDIYALGATFYYLVTGVRPFVADTPVEILLKHVNEELVPPLKRAPDLPPGVSKIIEKMLVKDRDKRYQSLRDVLKDLEAVQKGQEVKVEVVSEAGRAAIEERSIFEGAAAGSVAGSEIARSPSVALATERPRSFYYLVAGLGASTLLALALGAGPIREILVSAAELTPREIEAERRLKALEQAGERSKEAVERWRALAADMGQTRVGAEARRRAEALAAELAKAADDRVRSALDEAQRARAAGRYAAAVELLRAVPAEVRESPLAKSIDPEIAATLDELARRRGQAYVPAGPFVFCENEMQKRIELPAFYIDIHEVSNRDWAAYVQGGGRAPARWVDGQPPPGTEDLPVTGISVRDAFEYARTKGRGKRVPNIYEWEKAARGPDGRRFPWGDELDHGRANQRETGPGKLEAVTSRPSGASPFGCLHMAGNAAEWAVLPQAPDAASEPEAWVKGGAYGDDLISCRSAFWLEVDRETKASGHEAIGLRLVQDVEP